MTTVTDTGPCAAQEYLTPTPGGLVRDTHTKPPKCRLKGGMGGSWKQRHLSQTGDGVHGTDTVSTR